MNGKAHLAEMQLSEVLTEYMLIKLNFKLLKLDQENLITFVISHSTTILEAFYFYSDFSIK